ncbi:Rieske 2Fe-2S domain-containing protein [Herbaspirillum rhizosphaerae]|uniref:Rieske 2Fe-2S domain-containing protein n=1 Tax=Herbaspirillum rhizosphaerae TaxID=346179 RepID=UPI00067E2693|nr:Rieske 2Fe-2S domain-containing protein [Herbaspirillum rhizosphaerae]
MTVSQALALSNAVECSQVILARAPELEMALWRDSTGALHANQNRCPHRGMRLHFGFVRDDRLNCLYHGWSYDHQGQCKYIPAHPSHTPSNVIFLQTHGVQEAHGIIWRGQAPAMPEHLAAMRSTPVRSVYLAAALTQVRAAMSSLSFDAPDAHGLLHAGLDENAGYWLPADGNAPQNGCLYALQDAGEGKTGIHLAALTPAGVTAPTAWLLALSSQLQRVQLTLKGGAS